MTIIRNLQNVPFGMLLDIATSRMDVSRSLPVGDKQHNIIQTGMVIAGCVLD
jgi:ABC-type iron transport system FetAB ATPase subunit